MATSDEKNDEKGHPEDHGEGDQHTLLKILEEKDNLIVSLKESATKRDKLNEKQIRLLSEDNSQKSSKIKTIQTEMRAFEARVHQKEAELSVFKVTEEKLTHKVEEFKVAFEQYKTGIHSALDQIKISITEEFAKREEYKEQLLEKMQVSYEKLKSQINEVDKYYKDIITEISKKQGMAKKFIRQALNNLQEGLSYLDMSHMDISEPLQAKEEFARVMSDSSGLFEEFKELKGKFEGSTIIKNIENVNIELSQAPVIEGVFREINEIKKIAWEDRTPSSGGIGGSGSGTGNQGSEGGGGAGSGDAGGSVKGSGMGTGSGDEGIGGASTKNVISGGINTTGPIKIGKTSGGGGGFAGGGGGGFSGGGGTGSAGSSDASGGKEAIAGSFRSGGAGSGKGTDGAGQQPARDEEEKKKPGQSPDSGGKGASISDDRVKEEEEEQPPKRKKSNEDFQEVVFKRGRNYAPFNWREILSDIQLERFQSIIENSIKAEKEGKLMKALGLYRTIREQPGIGDTIAGRLLDDHIEYLEDIIKRKYSFEYRPVEAEKTTEIS